MRKNANKTGPFFPGRATEIFLQIWAGPGRGLLKQFAHRRVAGIYLFRPIVIRASVQPQTG